MAYADFTEYAQSYHGRRIKSEDDFLYFSERASEYMDSVTFDRLADGVPEKHAKKVLKCCCALSDALFDFADVSKSGEDGARPKNSESIGKYSVSYATTQQTISGLLSGETAGLTDYLHSICMRYIGSTGLMYRGFDADVYK